MPTEWSELIKTLGVAAPLVGVLLILLKQTTEERKDVTQRFLETLSTSIITNSNSLLKSSESIQDMANALKDNNAKTSEEHARLIDAIGKLGRSDRT